MPEIREIDVSLIDPSPYQHRQAWNQAKLTELAKSIKRDGLIEPIVVRCLNGTGRYELIAGERRLRACKLAEIPAILGRVVEVNDTQARRMCAAENLQREDLSAIEELYAVIEMLDAELIEDETYASFGGESVDRVKWLLMKLDSDRRHSTNYFADKFIGKVNIIFSNLPKPKEWESFYVNDFRSLVNIDADVAAFAAQNKLNKSQTVETQKLKDALPQTFESLKQSTNEAGESVTTILNENFEREQVEFRDLSAREIKEMTRSQVRLDDTHLLVSSSQSNEWYTPKIYIDAVRAVMGSIDLDPASNPIANRTIEANVYYTQQSNGLDKPWSGNVWLNPPWGDLTEKFIIKLVEEWNQRNLNQAIVLVNAHATDTKWFGLLWDYLLCFTDHRIDYYSPRAVSGTSTHGSVFIYLGDNRQDFINNFRQFGPIVKRIPDDNSQLETLYG